MKILLIAGWAHHSSSMNPLKELFTDYEVELTSVHELVEESGLDWLSENYSLALEKKLASYSEKPLVIGWSMGAMILCEILQRNHKLIEGAVVISGTLKFANAEDYSFGIDIKNIKALKVGLRRSFEKTLKTFYLDCSKPLVCQNVEKRIKDAEVQGVKSLNAGLDYLMTRDLRGLTFTKTAPLLIIHGENDSIIPYAAGEYLNTQISGSEFISIKDGNHDIINFDSKTVYNIISDFLKTNYE